MTTYDQLATLYYQRTGKTLTDDGPWTLHDNGYGLLTVQGPNAPDIREVLKVTESDVAAYKAIYPDPIPPDVEIAALKARVAELEAKEAVIEKRVDDLEKAKLEASK